MKEFVSTFHRLQQTNGVFEDREFPPTGRSLGPREAAKGYKWVRAKDLGGEYTLFESDESTLVQPEDVRQGQLGNCYFLASVSALTNKNPHLVE